MRGFFSDHDRRGYNCPLPTLRTRMNAPPVSPARLASNTLFEPIAALLARCDGTGLPDARTLSTMLREAAPDARTACGQALRFDPEPAPADGYEACIHDTGRVPTRQQDWHDFFNALSWCVWPRSKTAMNAAHVREIAARRAAALPGRGPRRDALTQFDECGMVVTSCDPEVLHGLARHAWDEVFWQRRANLATTTAFTLLGHASWDQLRAPFVGLCARTVHRQVTPDWFAQPAAERQRDSDAWLAARIASGELLTTPRALMPLPLLGIPGVTPDSEQRDYYRDTRQFRPLRQDARRCA